MFERYESVPNFELVEIDECERRLAARAIHRRLPLAVKQRLPRRGAQPCSTRVADQLARRSDVVYVPYVPPPRLFPFPDVPTVYSIHDIQHVHFPGVLHGRGARGEGGAFAKCVEHATAIQASSRYMARRVLRPLPEAGRKQRRGDPGRRRHRALRAARSGDDVAGGTGYRIPSSSRRPSSGITRTTSRS